MAFYSDFSGHYEKIFPLRENTYTFLDRWLSEDHRILDLGCGTGHYCGRLAQSGRDCLGIDLDPGMISQAEKTYDSPNFRIMDLDSISGLQVNSFGGIYCIGNVLPHLPGHHLPGFLSSVKALLKPGGRWIFQTVNFDPLLHLDGYEFPTLSFPDDKLDFHRHYKSTPLGPMLFQTRLMQHGFEVFSGETQLFPKSSSDYLTLNSAAGFNLLAHFSDFTGLEYISGKFSGSVYVFEVPGE